MRLTGLMSALQRILDTLWLSILWWLCVLLVVPAAAGTTALLAVSARMQDARLESGVTRAFARELRRSMRTATVVLGSWVVLAGVLAVNLSVVGAMGALRIPLLITLLAVGMTLALYASVLPMAIVTDPGASARGVLRRASCALLRAPLGAVHTILGMACAVVLVVALPLAALVVPGGLAHIAAMSWRRAHRTAPAVPPRADSGGPTGILRRDEFSLSGGLAPGR
ncbi:DUF624 domain-containing protein [Bogoriella caseilytica]|uniref:Putative membrane protein YesL n=1 Tax=Bogoriella caseilytica TaxID=56055 RepID=A0A3N2BDX7_9MICO|nr:DUF624 domain-containing protein [Bogoriella caseilytica]ROR73456.1 putative membrane protein YesL [Bogoriella caseilytica]